MKSSESASIIVSSFSAISRQFFKKIFQASFGNSLWRWQKYLVLSSLCAQTSRTDEGRKLFLQVPGCTWVAGVNWRKNCLFLSVTRPLPSTLTLYLLYPRSSMIRPVLSHLFAILPAPCWFWIITFDPSFSGFRSLVCMEHLSAPFTNRFRSATSRVSLQSTHTSAGEYCPGLIGR